MPGRTKADSDEAGAVRLRGHFLRDVSLANGLDWPLVGMMAIAVCLRQLAIALRCLRCGSLCQNRKNMVQYASNDPQWGAWSEVEAKEG